MISNDTIRISGVFLRQGSGKTLAFGIPLIDRILNCRKVAEEKAEEEEEKAEEDSQTEEKENEEEEVSEDEEVHEDGEESEEDMETSNADDEDVSEQDDDGEAGDDDEEASEVEDEADKDEDEDGTDDNKGVDKDDRPLYALVLTPTRELAFQIRDHLRSISKDTNIEVIFFSFLLDLCCWVVNETPVLYNFGISIFLNSL